MAVVQFFFHYKKPPFKERRRLRSFIVELFKKEKIKLLSLTCIFCSDEYLLNINKEFLNHDFYTDIITFNLASPSSPVEGELYISTDRIKENAKKEGVSFKEEIHRVVFHGVLHLCGYKDKTKNEITEMRKKEAKYLKEYL